MQAIWHFLLWCLACWSHDPGRLELDRARTAGAVAVAYAALAVEPPAPKREEPVNPEPDAPPAMPEPVAPKRPFGKEKVPVLPTEPSRPCPQCNDTKRLYRTDATGTYWVRCSCGPCTTSTCPTRRP
jgi:hypothetical protein